MVTLPESCVVRLALHALRQPESRLIPFCNILDLDCISRWWFPLTLFQALRAQLAHLAYLLLKILSAGVASPGLTQHKKRLFCKGQDSGAFLSGWIWA